MQWSMIFFEGRNLWTLNHKGDIIHKRLCFIYFVVKRSYLTFLIALQVYVHHNITNNILLYPKPRPKVYHLIHK